MTVTYAVTMTYTKGGKPQSQAYPGSGGCIRADRSRCDRWRRNDEGCHDGCERRSERRLGTGTKNGKDTLNLHMKAGLKEGDADATLTFETVK